MSCHDRCKYCQELYDTESPKGCGCPGELTAKQLERVKDKLRHFYSSGDYDHAHNCHATVTLNALRQSLGL